MATPQVKDLVLRSPAGSSEVLTFAWPLQIGSGQDKHDNGIDIIDTIKFVCDELPGISSAFEEINLNHIDTACYKTMTNLVDRFNKAVDSIVALEKGTSLPTERLNKFAHPSLLRHILQLVYNAAVLDPDKLNNYEPFSPEVYGETSYELVQQMIKHVSVSNDDTFIDLGSGVGQVVLQMAGLFPLKTCIGIEKADTPARYAERMDMFFRQFMAWFGKRYCEYKLLKGDFLVDEHREKITSSSLVFVNNFAFGPNVDHQLKERFADLRDGARIVSSKSFCPLNFRITDRNLSDIGTIMHLSEIPPLKGSVSWTCKPVSYYLHVIDRTILERYFQRLKTQKGSEHEHVGSTRTTRDRAKREANNHAMNQNSNSSCATLRTSSPATVVNNQVVVATTPPTGTATTKTRQQQQQLLQQQQQLQQQRSLDMETSTESDGNSNSMTGATNGGTNTNNSSSRAPSTSTTTTTSTIRTKVWSDWGSSKGKSSQSEDEEENNNNSNSNFSGSNARSARATTQKKRKKLTRKAAIASKSAAAAQAAAREREAAAAAAAAKDSPNKEDGTAKGRKGRIKKGPGRVKKSVKIVGLDVLHKQTLLSTSAEVMSKKLPVAPGCVDQQLTSLLTGDMSHTELEIPTAPQDTPYALQILLDVFRSQYMALIEQMKAKAAYVPHIRRQIQLEQERKQRIKNRASQLDKQIKVLIDDSVALLKVRMNELGINVNSPNDLIAKAKEIVGRHKELQGIAKKIQSQVGSCELEQKRLLKKQLQQLPEYQKLCNGNVGSNGRTKLESVGGHELSEAGAHELLLKEIANTLAQRKRLCAQVSHIEQEACALEQAAEAQRNSMSLAVAATAAATTTVTVASTVAAASSIAPSKSAANHVKSAHRRSRDHRTRSQEWPDVPDVGKIEESNPEVLAQKILETGRQIEAGKFTNTPHKSMHNNSSGGEEKRHRQSRSNSMEPAAASYIAPHDSALMPAPPANKNQGAAVNVQAPVSRNSILPKCELPGSRKTPSNCSSSNNSNLQESPKVANFEDRLKSIITSALNEDQEQRKAQHQQPVSTGQHLPHDVTPTASPQQSPAPKRSKHATTVAASSTQQLPPNNINNLINVAAQGLTHLNASTTISPITPPPLPPVSAAQYATAASQHYNKYNKHATSAAASSSSAKYHHQQQSQQQQHQQQQHLSHMQQMHQTMFSANSSTPAELSYHRRRSSISAGSSYEHFATQQQHQQALMLAAAAAAAAAANQPSHHQPSPLAPQLPLEFKAPTTAEHMQQSQRCSSRGDLLDEAATMAPRSSSANSDSSIMYYAPTRDRLMSLERSLSRESALSQQHQLQQQHHQQQPSRPSSNSSQPDYTQVSPAKMALRRHLSQEKLSQQHPGSGSGSLPLSSKTIGDLVNGEIERTLEISHQSIINAVVNMSTVGALERSSGGGVGGGVGGGGGYVERERDRSNERLLINPNAQRPERVHVRVLDEQSGGSAVGAAAYTDISPRSSSGRKSPQAHNLSTLAHVAYNHKSNVSAAPPHDLSSGMKLNSATSAGASRGALHNFNHREAAAPYHPHHHMPSSSTTTAAAASASTSTGRSASSTALASSSSCNASSTSLRDYQAVTLPRAEMKGCIEAYFSEEQQQHQLQQLQPKSSKERVATRNGRINGGNAPLEGLAASLQDHLMASRKFKEENEERQRRAAVAASTTDVAQHHQHFSQHLGATGAQQHHVYQSAASTTSAGSSSASLNHNGGTPAKAEVGLKRTSPVVSHHPRPSKMPHYSHEHLQQQQQHLQHHPHHAHSHHSQQNHHATVGSTSSNAAAGSTAHAMSAHNPYANANGACNNTASASSSSSSSSSSVASTGRRTKMPLEPLLMSPEINSIMGDDLRASPPLLARQQQHQQQATTPIVGGRAGDDDDVIADDETHWQHRVSSGFDRLVAFASTELDKTRRSIDTDTVPSSISCNTSPDSGITHSSSNSDAARTFLSTSSTSSQMDIMLPIGNGGGGSSSSASSGFGAYHHHHMHHQNHHHNQHLTNDQLSDSSMKSSHSDTASSLVITLKTTAADLGSAIESPSLSDVGLPRTPSPNTSLATPPLAAVAEAALVGTKSSTESGGGGNNNNTLKIPLKYQRKSKSSSEKHYKKKFCERNWEYNCDELLAYSSSSSNTAADAAGTANGEGAGGGVGGGGGAVLAQEQPQLKAGKSPKVAGGGGAGSMAAEPITGAGGTEALASSAAAVAGNEPHHNSAQHSTNSTSTTTSHNHHHHHKSSKFRPKGKDWDWSLDSGGKNKAHVVTVATEAVAVAAATTNVN